MEGQDRSLYLEDTYRLRFYGSTPVFRGSEPDHQIRTDDGPVRTSVKGRQDCGVHGPGVNPSGTTTTSLDRKPSRKFLVRCIINDLDLMSNTSDSYITLLQSVHWGRGTLEMSCTRTTDHLGFGTREKHGIDTCNKSTRRKEPR